MAKSSKKKKPNPARQKVGQEAAAKPHPGPWGSVLWDHLEDIRKWRMKRTKWEEVVVLLAEKGVTITPAAARNFFVRSRNPNLKLPDYLEHLRPQQPVHPPPQQPDLFSNHPVPTDDPDRVFDEARERTLSNQKPTTQPPVNIQPKTKL